MWLCFERWFYLELVVLTRLIELEGRGFVWVEPHGPFALGLAHLVSSAGRQ